MAKRGRKPLTDKPKKGYWFEREEQAVLDYLAADTAEEKNCIYEEILRPAFNKMVESIIRRYKLYIPDETFEDTFNDTSSFLLTKADKYRPIVYFYKETKSTTGDFVEAEYEVFENADENSPSLIKVYEYPNNDDEFEYEVYENEGEWKYYKKGCKKQKAYSYYGTICKNYLIGRIQNYTKHAYRNPSYDSTIEEYNNNINYSDVDEQSSSIASEVVSRLIKRIGELVDNPQSGLKENEIKLGIALKNLLENWEFVLTTDGSNKLNKSACLLFLKDNTGMDAKGIRDNMKKFKREFLIIKNFVID